MSDQVFFLVAGAGFEPASSGCGLRTRREETQSCDPGVLTSELSRDDFCRRAGAVVPFGDAASLDPARRQWPGLAGPALIVPAMRSSMTDWETFGVQAGFALPILGMPAVRKASTTFPIHYEISGLSTVS